MAVAVAAAAEEVLQHIGPDPRVEETKNAAGEEELVGDDEEILRFMDTADGYLLLMDSLSSVLRQGWLDLASARHSMGASRVSSTLFDHKEQSAATKLQVDYSAELQPSESNPHFSLSKWCLQEESNSSDVVSAEDSTKPKLRYRGAEATPAMNQMQQLQSLLLLLTGAVRFKGQDQKHYQSSERWCLQNYEQPKFHLKQHLN
ncbi:unnamed protein product [Alopecurus aequalis]